jgi:hypothetical protein
VVIAFRYGATQPPRSALTYLPTPQPRRQARRVSPIKLVADRRRDREGEEDSLNLCGGKPQVMMMMNQIFGEGMGNMKNLMIANNATSTHSNENKHKYNHMTTMQNNQITTNLVVGVLPFFSFHGL